LQLQFVRSTFYNLLPYLLIGFGYYLLPAMQPRLDQHRELLNYLPYFLFVLTALMSFHFNRSRVFFCLLQLTLLYPLFHTISSGWSPDQVELLVLMVGILVPLNLLFVSLFADRSLVSIQNYGFIALLLIEVAGVFWLLGGHNQHYLHNLLEFSARLTPVSGINLPPLALIVVGGVTIMLLMRLTVASTPINNSLVAILILLSLALNGYRVEGLMILLFALAGLILLISLVQDSYNMAYQDELTGLMGRRALNDYLARLGRCYVIAMVDVDFFKKFNDKYGHDVGDQVLKMVAAQLMRTTGGARTYRYGGEEFTLVFPRKQMQQVLPHLEAVREMIANYPLAIRDGARPVDVEQGKKQREKNHSGKGDVYVAVSIGVAERNTELKIAAEVLKAADQALYRAKKLGRNRVECF